MQMLRPYNAQSLNKNGIRNFRERRNKKRIALWAEKINRNVLVWMISDSR
jgi:hypothetical protein